MAEMRTLLKVANWLTFTAVPACLVYFTDFSGFATRLDEAVSNIAPALGALVPFVAITIGTASAALAVKGSWAFGCQIYLNLLHGDAQEFHGNRVAISSCKSSLIAFHDEPAIMFGQGELVARYSQLHADLTQLFKQLARLNIWVPSTFNLNDDQERIRLVAYLTTLESLAHKSNLEGAKSIAGLPH